METGQIIIKSGEYSATINIDNIGGNEGEEQHVKIDFNPPLPKENKTVNSDFVKTFTSLIIIVLKG